MSREVSASPDFHRILALPRRTLGDDAVVTAKMSQLLRAPGSQASLRPIQAAFLYEIAEQGGGFGPLQVGTGKTLVSLLAPVVMGARRPALLLPAGLVSKTRLEMLEYAKHWRVCKNLQIYSYESLGRVSGARQLEFYSPDLLILDECHKVKNYRAAVTRRMMRYMLARPETRVIGMSGTVMSKSVADFGHILGWCLKDKTPVPLHREILTEWAEAIDEKVNPLCRREPGALLAFGDNARDGFFKRVSQTSGVVISQSAGDFNGSLSLSAVEFDVNAQTEENLLKLRSTWCTPDGWALTLAPELWAAARQLALGVAYQWNPRPPPEWLAARKEWAKFVRTTISNSMYSKSPLDSELQVANAVKNKALDDGGLLDAWHKIKPTFLINSVPVWHDDSALKQCEHWIKHHTGIVWTEHQFFAEELARRTSLDYYGAGGMNRRGEPIEKATGSIIASIAANGTGRNLQTWSQALITSLPAGAGPLEQLLGRMHRQGQQADSVSFDFLFGCKETYEGLQRALGQARMQQEALGQTQKILLADISIDGLEGRLGARWQ